MTERKLKAQCIEKDISFEELSSLLGISISTFYRKLSNETFTVKEMRIIANHLNWNSDDLDYVFFTNEVA